MFTENLEHIDRILDELEALARSKVADSRFYLILTERLRLTLAADSAVLMLPIAGNDWLPVAISGADPRQLTADLQRALVRGTSSRESLVEIASGRPWMAAPIRQHDFAKGCLAVSFADSIPEHAAQGMVELLSAFAEMVVVRQSLEFESFLAKNWEKTHAVCRQLETTRTLDSAATLLVSGAVTALGAARVTLVTAGQSGLGKVRAVSGVPSINDRAEVIRSLQQLANEVLRTGQPVLRQLSRSNAAEGELSTEISSDGSFQNLICTRFSTGGNGSPGSAPAAAAARGPSRVGAPSPAANSALVIEYRNYDELVVGATHLPLLLPSLSMAWEQQSRLLHIPRFVRTLGTLATTPGRLARPALGWLALAGVLIVVGWLLLRPSPLVIEALGNVEPAISRAVFASADGFVENLVVRDGDRVKQGEILIRIRSPELEIKIQGAQGELNALEKEASGLRIALNQLDPDSPDVLSHQSQLASKVAEIDTRRQNLIRQIELLNHEKSLLALTSPIDGTVVAKDIEQRLERRPVRRGEPLLDIVDLDGPWQIRVHVADHDSGYVLDHYAASHASERSDPEETASNVVRYVIDSAPEYSLSARVSWIADQVENLHGEGSFVEVRATLDKQFPQLESNHDDVHMGAGVHAYFDCGQQPVWFVWFRPLIEAAQRRMWFRSHEHE